jgi:glycerol transport system substrate-binding protein
MKLRYTALAVAAMFAVAGHSWAGEAEAKKWVDSRVPAQHAEQGRSMAEMKWFIDAAKKLQAKGVKEINVVSETITTHEYEAKTLAKAFTEITGITVKHDLIQEGDVVEKLQTSMQSGKSIYDGWISDSDLIGTHYRYGKIMNLTDYMAGAGKEFTNPGLDIKDFIGTSFTTATDGKLYQLPDQQFANLYWFRADLFARQDLKDKFKAKYGYDLGVPLNWSAYEDIAEFFTNDVKNIDGKPIYGHMDYGKKDPSLGWRFTDAWLSMAGTARQGHPERRAGGRVGHPRGRQEVRSGGGLGLARRCHQLARGRLRADQVRGLDEEVRPEGSHRHDLRRSRPGARAGPDRAADLLVHRLHRRHDQAGPAGGQRRRHAEVAHGARPERPVLEGGMQNGYQDVGSWTFFKDHDANRTAAAWLYAQFVTAKTVSLKKTVVGLTPIRESDIQSKAMTDMAPKLGGLVEFYRSPARVAWTPTGTNVPDYPKLAQLWWKNVAVAVTGEKTPQQAMDNLAEEMDQVLARLERAGMATCAPKLNKKEDPKKWLSSDKGAPWAKLANEKPKGETIAYDALLNAWKAGKVR